MRANGRVGILALNSDRDSEYFLAVPWAGRVLDPVNTRSSRAEITYALNDSGKEVLPIDEASAKSVPGLVGH